MRKQFYDRLAAIERNIIAVFYAKNDDGFMDALGVDREKYQVKNTDGSIGYDCLQALSDTAAEDWK